MNNILEIRNLMLFYENALAVNNINMTIPEGKIVGVFGPNAAGKSSLMSCISGIIIDVKEKEETRGGENVNMYGNIIYSGKDITELMPYVRAKMGIILCPERRRIFPESSTMENLKIGAHLATKSQAKETLDYVLELFPLLKKLANRQGGFLSGGEQQMLAIGRALMAQPKLLLLDEPLLGLAPVIEHRLAEAAKAINADKNITIIISEQYARPVLPIIDYGYVLENGGQAAEGTPDELMENPDVKEAYFGVSV